MACPLFSSSYDWGFLVLVRTPCQGRLSFYLGRGLPEGRKRFYSYNYHVLSFQIQFTIRPYYHFQHTASVVSLQHHTRGACISYHPAYWSSFIQSRSDEERSGINDLREIFHPYTASDLGSKKQDKLKAGHAQQANRSPLFNVIGIEDSVTRGKRPKNQATMHHACCRSHPTRIVTSTEQQSHNATSTLCNGPSKASQFRQNAPQGCQPPCHPRICPHTPTPYR